MTVSYSLTLPRGWHRFSPEGDFDEQVHRLGCQITAADRDTAAAVLSRRRFGTAMDRVRETARQAGALDLFAFVGPSRTGLGPMSLVTSVVHLGACVADALEGPPTVGAAGSMTTLETAGGPCLRVLARASTDVGTWWRALAGHLDDLDPGRDDIALSTEDDRRVLSTADVGYAIDIPGHQGSQLMLSFSTMGGPFVGAQIDHGDSIARTLRWT